MSPPMNDHLQARIEPPVDLGQHFRVGHFLVDPMRREVSRDGTRSVINPKDLEVLRELARRPGQVISKKALMAAVWGDQIVGDHALTNAIHQLRKAFSDDPKEPSVIRTVHRRGYELVAPITSVPPSEQAVPSPGTPPAAVAPIAKLPTRWRIWTLLSVLFLIAIWAIRLGGQGPHPIGVGISFSFDETAVDIVTRRQIEDLEDVAKDFLDLADRLRLAEANEEPEAMLIARVDGQDLRVEVTDRNRPSQRYRGSLQTSGASRRALRRAVVALDASQGPDEHLVDEMTDLGSMSRFAYEHALSGDRAWERLDFASAEQEYDLVVTEGGLDSGDPYALERRARLYEAMLLIDRAQADLERAGQSVFERGIGEEQRVRLNLRSRKLRGEFAALKRQMNSELQVRAYDPKLQARRAWQLFVRERDCEEANRVYGRLLEQPGGTGDRSDLAGRSIAPLLMCGEIPRAHDAADRYEADVRDRFGDEYVGAEGSVAIDRTLVFLVARNLDAAADVLEEIPSTAMRAMRETYSGDLAFVRGEMSDAFRHYRSAAAAVLAVDQIRGFLRGAIARCVDGQAEEARHQAENAREIAFRRVPESEADALLTDQMIQIRGVLAMTSLAAGDVEAARAESAKLQAILALRAARNGGEIKYDRYREEWAHLAAGALLVHDGDEQAAEATYRKMLEVRPYDEPHFLPFLERLAASDGALAVVVNEMRAVLGFEPLAFAAQID